MNNGCDASGEKGMVRNGKKRVEIDMKEVLERCKVLQKRMRNILECEYKNNKEGKVAMEKIKHVEEVCNMLMNRAFQECLLDEGILNEIKGWL